MRSEGRDHSFVDPDRLAPPAVVLRGRYGAGAGVEHAHRRVQVLRCAAGEVVQAVTFGPGPPRAWTLRSAVALCIPAGMVHRVDAGSAHELLSAYLSPRGVRVAAPRLVAVTPLLAALFDRIEDWGLAYDAGPAERRVRAVLVDELHRAPEVPSWLWLPPAPVRGERLRHALAPWLQDPANATPVALLAARSGMSTRTLERLALRELGVPLARWRLHRRLQAAVLLLEAGRDVRHAAAASGYAHASNFVAAFRRHLGLTPGEFLRGRIPGGSSGG